MVIFGCFFEKNNKKTPQNFEDEITKYQNDPNSRKCKKRHFCFKDPFLAKKAFFRDFPDFWKTLPNLLGKLKKSPKSHKKQKCSKWTKLSFLEKSRKNRYFWNKMQKTCFFYFFVLFFLCKIISLDLQRKNTGPQKRRFLGVKKAIFGHFPENWKTLPNLTPFLTIWPFWDFSFLFYARA